MAALEKTMNPAEGDFLESPAAGGAAVRGGTLRIAGYMVSALAGAGSAAVLFRHFHSELTGLYVLASAIAAIVGGMSDLGMTTLGLRELAVQDAARRYALMRILLGLRLCRDGAWRYGCGGVHRRGRL